jgi:glucose-1-phosphate thymidylyltransferase
MKGIILAGGKGSRLAPITTAVSKQLLPVYGQPMIYYPLSTLISFGVKEVLVITAPDQESAFRQLLANGSQFGIDISYRVQKEPNGIAEAFIIAESWLLGEPSVLILGDNLLSNIPSHYILRGGQEFTGAEIFGFEVASPGAYGVIDIDETGRVMSIEEKPKRPKSNIAIPGLYFVDGQASQIARSLTPSGRGEVEIVDLLNKYMSQGELRATVLPRGTAWMDMGTPDLLNDATNYVRAVEKRQGLKLGCPEEAALLQGFITTEQLSRWLERMSGSDYGEYLRSLLK